MVDLLQVFLKFVGIRGYGFVSDQVQEVLNLQALADLLQLFLHRFLQGLRHPNNSFMTAFGGDELAAGNVGFSNAGEAWVLLPATRG